MALKARSNFLFLSIAFGIFCSLSVGASVAGSTKRALLIGSQCLPKHLVSADIVYNWEFINLSCDRPGGVENIVGLVDEIKSDKVPDIIIYLQAPGASLFHDYFGRPEASTSVASSLKSVGKIWKTFFEYLENPIETENRVRLDYASKISHLSEYCKIWGCKLCLLTPDSKHTSHYFFSDQVPSNPFLAAFYTSLIPAVSIDLRPIETLPQMKEFTIKKFLLVQNWPKMGAENLANYFGDSYFQNILFECIDSK